MEYTEDRKWFDYNIRIEEGRAFQAYKIAKLEAENAPSATAYFNMWRIISYKIDLASGIFDFREEIEGENMNPWDQLYSGLDLIAEAVKYDDWNDNFKELVIQKYALDVVSANKRTIVNKMLDMEWEVTESILEKVRDFKKNLSDANYWDEYEKMLDSIDYDPLKGGMFLDSCYKKVEKEIEECEKEKLKSQGRLFGRGKALAEIEKKLADYRERQDKIKEVIAMNNNVTSNIHCLMDEDAVWDHITEHFHSGWSSGEMYESLVAAGWEEQEEKRFAESQALEQEACEQAAPAASGLSGADELRKYKELLDAGVITLEDFEKAKRKILG